MGATNYFTKTLTEGTLTITSADNATRVSVICRQGSISYSGSLRFQGMNSDTITLEENQGVTLSASATANPIDGIVITSATANDIAEIIISTS